MASFLFFAFVPLPRAYFATVFHRPEEFLPALFFVMAFVSYYRKGAWRRESFEHWLLVALMINAIAEIVYMPFSAELYDLEFNIAHILKNLSYMSVLTGLMINARETFKIAEQSHVDSARRVREISLLHGATTMVADTKDVDEAIQQCINMVCEMTGWPIGHAYVPDPVDSEHLRPTQIWHVPENLAHSEFRQVTQETSFRKGAGLPGRVLATGRAAWIVDVQKDNNFSRARACHDIGIRVSRLHWGERWLRSWSSLPSKPPLRMARYSRRCRCWENRSAAFLNATKRLKSSGKRRSTSKPSRPASWTH